LLSEYGFCSFINVNIRLPVGQNHSCLDHAFIRDNFNSPSNINAGVLLTDITDHCSTVISIPVPVKTTSVNKSMSLIMIILNLFCVMKNGLTSMALTLQTTVSLSF